MYLVCLPQNQNKCSALFLAERKSTSGEASTITLLTEVCRLVVSLGYQRGVREGLTDLEYVR